MSFNLGTPKTATGFTLPTSVTPSTTAASGGAGDTKQQTKPLIAASTTAPTNTGFSLNFAPKSNTPTLSFAISTSAAPSSSSLTFAAAGSAGAPQFSLGSNAASTATTTTAATTFFTPVFGTGTSLLSSTTTPVASTPLKLTATSAPTTTTATSTPSFGLGGISTATTQTTASISSTTTTTTATTTVSSAGTLTYAQLEDSINKWTIDLEEQAKFFINQAKQLNAWDSLLVSNGDKILQLNETIERVKQHQKQLDQELDFILAQQNELDELSAPLEKQLAEIPITDQNRFQTYQLAEIIDSQLKQMSEDLKEIVEHLNESNKNEDLSDPIIQISRILNAHMNSLQWIDRNTAQITNHLEQITHIHETYKKNTLNL